MPVPLLNIADYTYLLPADRIAKFPLEKRDDAKLLHFEAGDIRHRRFEDLPSLIPDNTLIAFNNSKVIPARLVFQKKSGARIEIFLLQPLWPSTVIAEAMVSTGEAVWEAMIGNLKRWKDQEVLEGEFLISGEPVRLNASLENREKRTVRLSWDRKDLPFVSIVEAMGEVPLPPYLNRAAVPEDKFRYQTVYSSMEGAVAAPTAGLHFTEPLMEELSRRKIKSVQLTLHVGAGTFQPVKEENVTAHPMHSEQVQIQKSVIGQLLTHHGNILAVGTTSVRTLESIYWFGVKLLNGEDTSFFIPKLYPYQDHGMLPGLKESLQAVFDFMEKNNLEEIGGSTELMIMPGYEFKVCNAMLTNFHQPGSTLILLVAAFTKGRWREIYEEALAHGYRFLSYGDSNLLWHHKIT